MTVFKKNCEVVYKNFLQFEFDAFLIIRPGLDLGEFSHQGYTHPHDITGDISRPPLTQAAL